MYEIKINNESVLTSEFENSLTYRDVKVFAGPKSVHHNTADGKIRNLFIETKDV